VSDSRYSASDVRTNSAERSALELLLHDDHVQVEQMCRQTQRQAAIRQTKMTQGLAPEHLAYMEALQTAQVLMESAQTVAPLQCKTPTVSHLSETPLKERDSLAPMCQRPIMAKIGVGTSSETGNASTLQASTRVETNVKPLRKETPHRGHEHSIGKGRRLRKESEHHGDANDLVQDIASAVDSFLANPKGEWELDDSSGEHSDCGEDQANLDSSSCDESSKQAEDVTDHIANREQACVCLALAPEASIKGKTRARNARKKKQNKGNVEKASYQDSKCSSSILLQNFPPDLQKSQCLERGRTLCRKLLMLPLPEGLEASHLPGLCISITSCILMLYKEMVKPTVVAVQQRLRERDFEEVIVQSLLPICARMPDLYKIWLQRDCQACLLLSNRPLSDANLEVPTEVEAQCTRQFLEALTEILNKKRHPVTPFAAGNAVCPQTSESSTSRTRPVLVVPPRRFHAAGSHA